LSLGESGAEVFDGVMVAVVIDEGVCAVDPTDTVADDGEGVLVFSGVELLPVWREENCRKAMQIKGL